MTALPAIRVDAKWGDISRTVPCPVCSDPECRVPAHDALQTIVIPPTACPTCGGHDKVHAPEMSPNVCSASHYPNGGTDDNGDERIAGDHCNHAMTSDICHWCGVEWTYEDEWNCPTCHGAGVVPVVWPESNQVLLVIEQYGWGDEWGDQPLGDDGMYDDRRLAGVAVADVEALLVYRGGSAADARCLAAYDEGSPILLWEQVDGPTRGYDDVWHWFPDGLPAVGSLALRLSNLRVLDEPVTEVRCPKPGDPWPDGCGGGCDWCGGTGNGLNGLLPTVVEVELR